MSVWSGTDGTSSKERIVEVICERDVGHGLIEASVAGGSVPKHCNTAHAMKNTALNTSESRTYEVHCSGTGVSPAKPPPERDRLLRMPCWSAVGILKPGNALGVWWLAGSSALQVAKAGQIDRNTIYLHGWKGNIRKVNWPANNHPLSNCQKMWPHRFSSSAPRRCSRSS
jgi:hypothetical protein